MGEGNQGELMAIEAADVDMAVFAGLHAQAGDGVHGVVVADAEAYLVQHVLQKVAGPGHRVLGRKFRKILEPFGTAHRQFVNAASLLQQQIAGSFVQREVEHARGQLAHQIHKGPALHADEARLAGLRRIAARKFNVGVRGHDRETALVGLEPDGTQIGSAGLGRDDGRGFLQAFNDLLFVYSKFHIFSLILLMSVSLCLTLKTCWNILFFYGQC